MTFGQLPVDEEVSVGCSQQGGVRLFHALEEQLYVYPQGVVLLVCQALHVGVVFLPFQVFHVRHLLLPLQTVLPLQGFQERKRTEWCLELF